MIVASVQQDSAARAPFAPMFSAPSAALVRLERLVMLGRNALTLTSAQLALDRMESAVSPLFAPTHRAVSAVDVHQEAMVIHLCGASPKRSALPMPTVWAIRCARTQSASVRRRTLVKAVNVRQFVARKHQLRKTNICLFTFLQILVISCFAASTPSVSLILAETQSALVLMDMSARATVYQVVSVSKVKDVY